ncbi:MAG TPA: hypothetical protein VFC57_05835, partial [Aeromicrobium sp.]|nr:hypothetical protein [Aeromicrobium sp.]
ACRQHYGTRADRCPTARQKGQKLLSATHQHGSETRNAVDDHDEDEDEDEQAYNTPKDRVLR